MFERLAISAMQNQMEKLRNGSKENKFKRNKHRTVTKTFAVGKYLKLNQKANANLDKISIFVLLRVRKLKERQREREISPIKQKPLKLPQNKKMSRTFHSSPAPRINHPLLPFVMMSIHRNELHKNRFKN